MPEYLSPGVYIEELSGPRSIEGVSTSTAGFLGQTERGPQWPVLIGSFIEYQNWFGGYSTVPGTLPAGATAQDFYSYLPYAVQGFFDNGGKMLYVARVAGNNSFPSNGTAGGIHFTAVGGGTWGNRIAIQVVPTRLNTSNPNLPPTFGLRIAYWSGNVPNPLPDLSNLGRVRPDVLEAFDDLVMTPGASNNVESVVNSASHLIRVWLDPNGAAPDPGQAAQLDAGVDAAPAEPDFTGQAAFIPFQGQGNVGVKPDLLGFGWGRVALDAINDISLYAAPDHFLPSAAQPDQVTLDLITTCEDRKDRFAVVSTNRGITDVNNVPPNQDTSYAAVYYPWIKVFDPVTNGQILVPPTGHITGLMARVDIERGVHKAPANEVVVGATDLEFPVTETMQNILNPRGVDCIRDFTAYQRGIRCWGARTMSSDPEWKYVNVRRLFIFIEQSILKGTQWVVFEPNDDSLWAQVRRTISGFLTTVWKSGALLGLTEDQAFFVKCDRTTMTQDDIDNGRLICYIGIAPTKPAEFVIFRIQQKTQEAQAA